LNEFYVKLLRYVIDTDGDTNKSIISQIVGGSFKSVYLSEFDVKQNCFYPTAHADVFDFAVAYFIRYNEIITDDVISNEIMNSPLTSEERKELIDIVIQVSETSFHESEYEYIRSQIIDNYVTNKSVNIYKTGMQQAEESENPLGALDYVTQSIMALKADVVPSRNSLDKTMTLQQLASIKGEEYLSTGAFTSPCASYGWETWDQAYGGLFPEEVTVLAGPKNSFKSGLLQKILMHNMFLGKPVVWATRENSITQNWNRLIAYYTGIALSKINTNVLDDEERKIVLASIEYFKTTTDLKILMVPPTECLTFDMLKMKIQMHFGGENPAFVAMDHIQRMQPKRNYGQKWENIQAVVEESKDFASFFQTAVLTPAHLNRAGGDASDANLTHMQFDSISQIVDNIFMCKPDPDLMWQPPLVGEYVGKPGVLLCTAVRMRNSPKDQVHALEVEPSVGMANEYVVNASFQPERKARRRSSYFDGEE